VKRIDHYLGIVLLGVMLLMGDGGMRWLAARSNAPGEARVSSLVLVDGAGKTRAKLAMNSVNQPELNLFDGKGRGRLQVLISPGNDPRVAMIDEKGQEKTYYGLMVGAPYLEMNGIYDQSRMSISTSTDAALVAEDGKRRTRLSVSTDADQCVTIQDKDGAVVFSK
jgi:hypothetical protein